MQIKGEKHMTRYLRCLVPALLALSATGCGGMGACGEQALFVSAAEADAFNDSKLQALSDEGDSAGGLVVYFDTDSSAIAAGDVARLAAVANYLVSNPQAEVFIEGHTDDVGSPEQNTVLSQARADMLAYYIVKYGALYDQVNTRAYGERYPVDEGDGEDQLKRNRRGVVEWASPAPALGYVLER